MARIVTSGKSEGAAAHPPDTEQLPPQEDISAVHRGVRKQAGIEGVRIHDHQHTFASQAAMQGIPLPVVARLLGHAQVQMTLRYAHVSDRDVEAAAERVGVVMTEIMNRQTVRPDAAP